MFEITRADVQKLVTDDTLAESAAARQGYLDRGYEPCSIRGCNRLVSPGFIRVVPEFDNQRVALCPSLRQHQQLLGFELERTLRQAHTAAGALQVNEAVEDAPVAEAPAEPKPKRAKAAVAA